MCTKGWIMRWESNSVTQLTCILVLMTSSGVFPNTLAAPAVAPNSPVSRGLMALLGSSPSRWKQNRRDLFYGLQVWFYASTMEDYLLSYLCTSSSGRSWRRSGWPDWSLVLVLWPSAPDKSPSVLRTRHRNQSLPPESQTHHLSIIFQH